jgi:lysosomal acid phosphatase
MRLQIFLLSFFLLNAPTFAQVQEDPVNLETLQLVQVIFRHGQRVPEYPYPTDPYNSDTQWKEGWGQLTEEGKKQEYLLGQYLRSRYKSFVAENYVANEMYILSSDLDRTILSAQLCLAGMFPTPNGTQWNPQLNWQPVPVHTIASAQDNVVVELLLYLF